MKDVSFILKQGMKIKLTHRSDAQFEPTVQEFTGISLANGAISGVYTKDDKGMARYFPIKLFKIEELEEKNHGNEG